MRQRYSKESIIQILQSLAKHLNKTNLSKADVAKVLVLSTVNYYFGSLGNALEAAGLDRTQPGKNLVGQSSRLSDDGLFQSLLAVENEIGCVPGYNEYLAHGKYSTNPFRKRFGKWDDVLAHYRKWKADKCPGEIESTNLQNETQEVNKALVQKTISPVQAYSSISHEKPEQLYGEPIDFRGLRHAPINEQGVVYLFGMVSRELGFYIESVQQGFPDCEAKCLYDKEKNQWAKVWIEFEYKASSFQAHGHDPKQCNVIVCWINDWPECPIDVIELRTEILKLKK